MVEPERALLVVGVGGSGKTYVLDGIAAAAGDVEVLRIAGDAMLTDVCVLARDVGAASTIDARSLADAVAASIGRDGLVVADDAHLLDATSVAALALLANSDRQVVAAARPNSGGPQFAELVQILCRDRPARHLDLFDFDQLCDAFRTWSEPSPPAELIDAVLELSRGSPGLAHDLIVGGFVAGGPLPRGVVSRIDTRLGRVEPDAADVAATLALSGVLPDEAVARVSGIEVERLALLIAELRNAGLAELDDDRLVPVVAQSLSASWSPADRRRRHRLTAEALLQLGHGGRIVAQHLRRADVTGEVAARAFIATGDALRWEEPDEAFEWYEQAVRAGAPPSATSIGRAEASLGVDATEARLLVDQFDRDDPAQRARAGLVLAAIDVADARPDRAARRLLDTTDNPDLDRAVLHRLAVPLLVSMSRIAEARAAVDEGGPVDYLDATARFADLVAEASLDAARGANPLPKFIEAAELAETIRLRIPPIISPHSLAAAYAEFAGDFAAADSILGQAIERAVGGPELVRHHRLTRAWIRFRQGRHDTGALLVQELDRQTLPPRDLLLLAAIDAGLARRSGDIARLQDSWTAVEAALVRQTADLTTFGPVSELVLTATRLGHHERANAVQARLDAFTEDAANAPPDWVVASVWHQVQLAVVDEDSGRAARAHEILDAQPEGPRSVFAIAVRAAAVCWSAVLSDRVNPDQVMESVDLLHQARLPWDGARLAGQAALRLSDAAASRSLLERARDLKTPLADPDTERVSDSPLSAREQEVAALVVDGLTYKEIGAQLYISAKTVEHHVARIRRRLGAESRQEMLAALRNLR